MGDNQSSASSEISSTASSTGSSPTLSPIKTRNDQNSIDLQAELAVEKDKVLILKHANHWPIIFIDFLHQTHPNFSYNDLDDFVAIHKATFNHVKNPVNREAKAFILTCDPLVDKEIPELAFAHEKVVAVELHVSKFSDETLDFVANIAKKSRKAQIPLFASICYENIENGKILGCIFENMDQSQVIFPLNGLETDVLLTIVKKTKCHILVSEPIIDEITSKLIKKIPITRLLIASPKNATDPRKSANVPNFYNRYYEIIDSLAKCYGLSSENIIQGTTHFTRKFLDKFNDLCEDDFEISSIMEESSEEGEVVQEKECTPLVNASKNPISQTVQSFIDSNTDEESVDDYYQESCGDFIQNQQPYEVPQDNEILTDLLTILERQKQLSEVSQPEIKMKSTKKKKKNTLKKTVSKKSTDKIISQTEKSATSENTANVINNRVADSEGRYQDSRGRWHGPDGKFIKTPDHALGKQVDSVRTNFSEQLGSKNSLEKSTKNLKTPTKSILQTKDSATLKTVENRVVDSEGHYQDSKGRWHDSNGRFCTTPSPALPSGKPVTAPVQASSPVAKRTPVSVPSANVNKSSHVTDEQGCYQDSKGRWHDSNGRFCTTPSPALPSGKPVTAPVQASSPVAKRTPVSVPSANVNKSSHVTDKQEYYQDSKGRWHDSNGRFCTAPTYTTLPPKSVAASVPVYTPPPASKPASVSTPSVNLNSSNRVTDDQGRYQDSKGRWHGDGGRFVTTPDYARSTASIGLGFYGNSSLFSGGGGGSYSGGNSFSANGCTMDRNGRWHGSNGRFCKAPW